ncbi:xin actin-binding repeat-containing protein 2 isoform X2 [Rhinatrema bivittatum]|nr:xin actin-binding repeat-containing protein 2 isoform X2 [Rhinatrema bivittatum]
MAMYQAAVSKKGSSTLTNAIEESETCTVPGGLASVKKQFEKGDMASSHNTFAQYQYQQKSVQEVRSSSEVTVKRSSQETKKSDHTAVTESNVSASQTEQVSVHEERAYNSNMASNFNQVIETAGDSIVDGETPHISAQLLKEQFERTAMERALHSDRETFSPGKQIKIINESQERDRPAIISSAATGLAERIHETSITRKTDSAAALSSSLYVESTNSGSMEDFPPPPPDLLQVASEKTEYSQSPEPSNSAERTTIPKDVYSKQRNLYELKRLYKHIHPEVRKNLEKDYFSEVSNIVTSQTEIADSLSRDVQQARYVFENTGHSPNKCMSPEREYLEWDEILKGEVQSMRWIFENQPLDSIKDESPDESNIKSIAEQEIIAGGDVKYTTWMFETQPMDALGVQSADSSENTEKVPELARGDVRTATWLFETQPLDSMNKIYQDKEQDSDKTVTDEITGGDVKNVKYLFETQRYDILKQLYSADEINLLQLRSELEEIKGDVKRTVKRFETEPLYVIRDSSGQVLEIKTVCREDIEKGDVRTARWMFETQPLDMINQNSTEVKVVRGISMEENVKGGVGKTKWLFETQPLDTIKENEETSAVEKEEILGADVYQKCWIFETQPFHLLKDNANMKPLPTEEIIGGDVSTTKHLFETVPMDTLKDNVEVGKLQRIVTTEEEKGDVRHQRWVFETKPLEQIREEKKECIKTVELEEIDKGDVSNCKNVFETLDLSKYNESHKIQVEGVTKGAVKLNKSIFETTPLYAIQDSLGKYHEVKTVRQEEVLRGDVRTCRWMFETRPVDQFDESIQRFQVIKGISAEEIQSGDVKTAKWLFETQPLDAIKYFSNIDEDESKTEQASDIVKGDVKMCKWLFETQPMETLYDKEEIKTDSEEIHKGDVKTCTWLFETQPLDAICDDSEKTIRLHSVDQKDIQGRDVRMACFLFETEKLENIQGEEGKDIKRVVEIDIQSGDVSSMKYIFENQSLDAINSSSEEVLQKIRTMQREDIQNGNVLNCRWLFENKSIDAIKENQEDNEMTRTVTDVQGGNVRKGCFIFETFSLDQIKDESSESSSMKTVSNEEIIKGDVKNYTMLFETQPLYAIQDKEGYYHEVTTVKKEEVIHGDVRGTRWLFETKPIDSINESDKVYVIKAVTQEDIQKGDVSAVRWRFETQPLDTISEDVKVAVHTIDSVQGGDVKASRQLFESDGFDKNQYVRTVSVSEIQEGNVKTSTWLFETHTMDEIRGEDSEYKNVKTVTMEDIQEGDVQQAVWLFENKSLDSIKETDESATKITREEIPQADVKTTTWLFETTPFHEFNESKLEKEEIIGKSIKETLKELYSHKVVGSHGIIIEADEIGDVRMAKYQLMNQESPEIQKEEIIKGNLQNIMMNLLSKSDSTERAVVINEEEKGNINLVKSQLMNRSTDIQVEKEEIARGDIHQAINQLFSENRSVKKGILIQEDERGDIKMTIYSLLNKSNGNNIQRDEVVGGDIKRTIHHLQSSAMGNEKSERVKIDESERGNVQFYTTCIESGALDYLKLLQEGSNEIFASEKQEMEEIIGGDVEGTKLILKKQRFQIERTVNEDEIIPGDVCNTVKIFMTEPENKSYNPFKEEVVKGDLKAALNSLSQAVNQTTVLEKEEIIKADLSATLKSLQESKHQQKETEKPIVIPGDIQGAIESLEKAANTKIDVFKEEIVHGNLEATLKSLKEAQNTFKDVDKEYVIRGDIQTEVQNLLEASSEKQTKQHQESIHRDIKSTVQTVVESSHSSVQCQDNTKGDSQNLITTLLESNEETCNEKEIIPKGDVQGTLKIITGHGQNISATNVNQKRLKGLTNIQHKTAEKVGERADKIIVKSDGRKEANYRSGTAKQNVKTEKSETCKTLKKESTLKDVTSAEQIAVKKHILHARKDGQKYKLSTDANIHQEARQTGKAKISTDVCTSKSQTTQQPITVLNSEAYQAINLDHKQMAKVETKQVQRSKEDLERSEMNIQPVQTLVSVTANQNIKSNQKANIIQEAHNIRKETEKKKKNLYQQNFKSRMVVVEKTKVDTVNRDSQSQMKNVLNPTKTGKEKSKPEIHFPPPPPSSVSSSATELPLPPPPLQMMMSDKQNFSHSPLIKSKAKTDFDHFPPPPPPVDDKLDSELLVPTPPPPPPPPSPPPFPLTVQAKEKKAHYSQQSQSSSQQTQITDKKSVKQSSSLPLKKVPKIVPTKELKKENAEVSLASKSSVFQSSVNNETSKVMHESEMSTELVNITDSEQRQDTTSIELKEQAKSLNEELPRPLPKSLQETPPAKKKVILPPIKSPSVPTETPESKPKPYVRKFKTPLMIAEEKYRQKRDESEKMKEKIIYHANDKATSEIQTNQTIVESESCVPLLTKTKEEGSTMFSTAAQRTPTADTEFHATLQTTTLLSNKQSASLVVSSATDQLQNILKSSTEKHIKEEVLQDSNDLKQQNILYEREQTDQEHGFHKTEQEKTMEQSHMSKIKTISPKFKVKTIKLPTIDQKVQDPKKDSEMYKKQQASNIQTVVKQKDLKTQKDERAIISEKQDVSEEYHHVQLSGAELAERKPVKHAESSQEARQKGACPIKQTIPKQTKSGAVQSMHENLSVIQEGKHAHTQVVVGQKEQKEAAERKQGHREDKSVAQVVKQHVEVHEGSQTHILKQKQSSAPGPKIQYKIIPKQYKTWQEKESVKDKRVQEEQVCLETKDTKETTENKQLFSSPTGSLQNEERHSLDILECLKKREELQQILSRVKQFEKCPPKAGTETFQSFLNIIPGWLISQERKMEIARVIAANNFEKIKKEISFIKDHAAEMYTSCEAAVHTAMMSTAPVKSKNESVEHGGASQKISNISTTSRGRDTQKKTEVTEERTIHHEIKQLSSGSRHTEYTSYSPLLKMRSPSPTYITIESTARRTESPNRDVLTPPPTTQKESTPVPPPPPRSTTPTARMKRSSPSPPRSRSEQLAKLKDTTAKLAHGATQPRAITPVPVIEKRSEIVLSPATLRRQLKIETHATETTSTTRVPISEAAVTIGTIKDVKEKHEETRKTKEIKSSIHKEPKNIPGQVGPDTDSFNEDSVTQKIKAPKGDLSVLQHKSEARNKVVYTRKEPKTTAERSGNQREDETEKRKGKSEETQDFDSKSAKKVLENYEKSKIKQEKQKNIKEESRPSFHESKNLKESPRSFPRRQLKDPSEDACYKQLFVVHQQHGGKEDAIQPVVCSETKSINEHFSGISTIENKTVGSRAATSVPQHSEKPQSGFDFKHAPPTYEDVISGHSLDISAADSPEELLRNFQKTWQESERVFKSLGYTVSDSSETEMRSSFHQGAAFITENSTSGKGSLRALSKDSLSNGMPDGRQAGLS